MNLFKNLDWLFSDWNTLLITLFSTILIYICIIIITRINGLRTFAKMSSFDFAITIAIGSILATTLISKSQSVANGAAGLIVLVSLQAFIAWGRRKSNWFENTISNTPVLLMDGSTLLRDNMKATRISESDVYAKLREANVTNFNQVLAVVLETTGDISVLHAKSDDAQLDRSTPFQKVCCSELVFELKLALKLRDSACSLRLIV